MGNKLIQELDRAIERGWANGGHLGAIRELAVELQPQPYHWDGVNPPVPLSATQAEPVAWPAGVLNRGVLSRDPALDTLTEHVTWKFPHAPQPQTNTPINGADAIVQCADRSPTGTVGPGNYVVPAAPPIPQPQAEPVAWYLPAADGGDSMFRDRATVAACDGNKWEGWRPLYTAPLRPQAELPEPMPPTTLDMPLTREQREVEDAFRRGWNSYRATVMLAAAPQPQPSALQELGDAVEEFDFRRTDGSAERLAEASRLLISDVPSGWQPIETAPTNGRIVLLAYKNRAGKWRKVRGQYMTQDYIDNYWEEPEDGEPGWYEVCEEAEDPPNCWNVDPTYWMPLPADPDAMLAAPQPQPRPQASAEDVALVDEVMRGWPKFREAWQRIRASLEVGRD